MRRCLYAILAVAFMAAESLCIWEMVQVMSE